MFGSLSCHLRPFYSNDRENLCVLDFFCMTTYKTSKLDQRSFLTLMSLYLAFHLTDLRPCQGLTLDQGLSMNLGPVRSSKAQAVSTNQPSQVLTGWEMEGEVLWAVTRSFWLHNDSEFSRTGPDKVMLLSKSKKQHDKMTLNTNGI